MFSPVECNNSLRSSPSLEEIYIAYFTLYTLLMFVVSRLLQISGRCTKKYYYYFKTISIQLLYCKPETNSMCSDSKVVQTSAGLLKVLTCLIQQAAIYDVYDVFLDFTIRLKYFLPATPACSLVNINYIVSQTSQRSFNWISCSSESSRKLTFTT